MHVNCVLQYCLHPEAYSCVTLPTRTSYNTMNSNNGSVANRPGGITAGGDRMHSETYAVGAHGLVTDALQGPSPVLQLRKTHCHITLQVLVSLAPHQ